MDKDCAVVEKNKKQQQQYVKPLAQNVQMVVFVS